MSWLQIGQNIDGTVNLEKLGNSVSLSSDGYILAIGAPYYNVSRGRTTIYQWNSSSSTWVQIGQNIDGTVNNEWLGSSLSLSSDGYTIAIGAPSYNFEGRTTIYQWNSSSSTWVQKGQNIDGTSGSLLGSSVSLSSDGSIVAIGSPGYTNNTGRTFVYQWNNSTSTWVQIGQNINGTVNFGYLGHSVSLSSDGSIVAIGSPGYTNNNGRTLIYQYNNSTSTWLQKGQNIDGTSGSFLGNSVSLSSDGSIVAISAPYYNGYTGRTTIYQWSSSTSSWLKKGESIDGITIGEQSGYSVSLSSDGSIVSIGTPSYNSGRGRTNIYQFNSSSSAWIQIGQNIYGKLDSFLGNSVSLSGDGYTIAIGAPTYNNTGRALVYNFPKLTPQPCNNINLSIGQLYDLNSLKNNKVIYAIGRRNKAAQQRTYAFYNRIGKSEEFIDTFFGICKKT